MSIKSYLGDWYRSAGIPPEEIPLAERWKAVESFQPEAGDIASLAQIFFELNSSDPSFPQRFRTAFNDVDPNFKMSNNDRELVVLAGAELADVMERGTRGIADMAALFLLCGAMQNIRTRLVVPQIPEIAAKYLSQRSANRATPEKGGKEEVLSEALIAVGEPYKKLAPEFQRVQLEFPIIAEESNMLWWLVAETSRDVNQRWSELPLGMVCVLSGKELADLTQVIPGPVAARAFLDRSVRSGRNKLDTAVSIKDVVNDTAKAWRESHFSMSLTTGLEGILPLSHAVILSVQASDDGAWRTMFKAATGVAATAKSTPDALAYQFYLERLTARSLAQMKKS